MKDDKKHKTEAPLFIEMMLGGAVKDEYNEIYRRHKGTDKKTL